MLWLAFVLSLYANLMFKPHFFWNLILYNEITERLSNDPAVVVFIYVQSTCFSEQGIRNYREVWTTDFQDGFPCMFPLYWWRQLKVSSRSFFGKRVLFTKKKKEITLCSAFLQSLFFFWLLLVFCWFCSYDSNFARRLWQWETCVERVPYK